MPGSISGAEDTEVIPQGTSAASPSPRSPQSLHSSGGASPETNKQLDKIYSSSDACSEAADMACSRMEVTSGRGWPGGIEFKASGMRGASDRRSQRKSVSGGRNREWKGALARQALCIVEERALTRGFVHVPCDF